MYHVLLVEDNVENCEMLCVFLGKAQCYRTDVAHDAESALQMAGTQPFDLILLDIMLPGMDGIRLCEELRKTLYCPIIFVSCLDDEETILRAFRMGGDDYITKPFRYPVLCARMEAVLRRVKQSASAPARDIRIGDMVLSVEQHAILKEGKTVNLSPIEYDILRYFAENPNRALRYEEIHLAYLEAREKMLADEEEITQAQEEGIQIHPAHTFEAIVGADHAEGVRFCRVKSFTFDENRRAHIEKEENSEYVIGADTVIFATGQRTEITPEAGLELGRANSIAVKQGSLQTSVPGIYACGDAVYGTRTVVEAVGAGRAAASEIDISLGGDGDISEVLAPVEPLDPWIGKEEGFGDKARAEEQFLCAKDRSDSFTPISSGISDCEICGEAGRCLQCDLRFQITGHRIWSDYIHEEKEGAQ